jgi:hypothetical protein
MPSWASRPNVQRNISFNSQITTQPTSKGTLGLNFSGARVNTRNNGNGVGVARNAAYLPDSAARAAFAREWLREFSSRIDQAVTRLSSSVNSRWQLLSWWDASMSGGIDYSDLNDQNFHVADSTTVLGNQLTATRTTTQTYSANVATGFSWNVTPSLKLRTGFGGQYVRNASSVLTGTGTKIPDGSTDIGAGGSTSSSTSEGESATAGAYINQEINVLDQLYFTVAARRDAGSAFGRNVKAPLYPKFSVSWIAWDHAPNAPILSAINTLRLRTAYGHSAVQPGATDATAQYHRGVVWYDNAPHDVLIMDKIGNNLLNPERTVEAEGGLDANLFNDRIQVGATMFRKRSRDALITQALGPSLGEVTSRLENVGSVLNAGTEVSISARIFDARAVSLDVGLSGSGTRNKLLSLGPNLSSLTPTASTKFVIGEPLFAIWALPFYGFNDVNGDGQLEPSEMLFGDSTVNVGWSQPSYSLNYTTSLGLLNGQLRVNATVSYENGVSRQTRGYDHRALVDRNASYADQIALQRVGTAGGVFENVSVTRFGSLGVSYTVPTRALQLFRAKSASISLFGTNLGLWTQYRGADPGVNTAVGEGVQDFGAVPLTRNWSMHVSLQY